MSEFPIPADTIASQYTEIVEGRKRVFALSATHVHVRMTHGFGSASDVRIPLEWLTPDYATWKFQRLNRRLGTISVLFAVLPAMILVNAELKPPGALFFILAGAALLGIGLLIATLATTLLPRVSYRFPNAQGIIVLDLIAMGPEKDRCEQFAEEIRTAILALPCHRSGLL